MSTDDQRDPDLSGLLREVLLRERDLRDTFARRLGVSPNEFTAMEHLILEPMGPVELSRRLDLTSAAATVLLHRLEESGHVQRRPHPTDRRRQIVTATESGRAEVFDQLLPVIEELDAVARSLGPAEREAVAGYLTRVAEVLRRTTDGS